MLTRRSFLAAFLFSLPTVETARPCTGIKLWKSAWNFETD